MMDPISDFINASRSEKGERVAVEMRKERGDAGFHLKCKGGEKAVAALIEALNKVNLSEHQP